MRASFESIDGFTPERNSPCPCGSEKKAKKCCLVEKNVFLKKPAILESSDQIKTNYAHPSCLASFTNDCTSKLTGEHFFSKSVLKLLDDHEVEIGGWPHNDKRIAKIPIKNLVVNCLCEKHNRMLSPLDETASIVFKALIDFNDASKINLELRDNYRLVNYWDFERWLIKTLVMASEAGFTMVDGVKKQLMPKIKNEYLQILFDGKDFSLAKAGFSLFSQNNQQFKFAKNFDFSPMTSLLTNEMDGCIISFGGIQFAFSPNQIKHIGGISLDEDRFRPWRLVFGKAQKERAIDFSIKEGLNHTHRFKPNQIK